MKLNSIYNGDCKDLMRKFQDSSINLYYTDTPYNLSSEYEIDKEGHYVFKGKGSDFMGKWEAMDGRWWYEYFKEVNRTLKDGGYFITHNIDRQADMWTYYARRVGLMPVQKLYWLRVDSFPKGVDITKHLDRLLGQERVVLGKSAFKGVRKSQVAYGDWGQNANEDGTFNLTMPTSDLAREFEGYFYGIASLKQVVEEILVFWKPLEEGVPKAILERRNKIHPSVFNLKNTSVYSAHKKAYLYTPQLLMQDKALPKLLASPFISHIEAAKIAEASVVIPYEEDDDLIPFLIEPKTSQKERDSGLENFDIEEVSVNDGRKKTIDNPFQRGKTTHKNPHPSPKPIRLCKWVLTLFKPPEKDMENFIMVDTFAGSGHILVAASQLDIPFYGAELDPLFYKIATTKIETLGRKLL